MQIFKSKGSDESTPRYVKRLLFERVTQIGAGLLLLAISSYIASGPGIGLGGHEDATAETQPEPKTGLVQKARHLKDVFVAKGSEGAHVAPRIQMGLTATTPLSKIEARREANNKIRLAKMYGPMQRKVAAVWRDMEGQSWKGQKWRPFADVGVYRTPAEQLKKFRQGYSKVTWGFHNATNPNGTPGSLAVDVADAHWGWSNKTPLAYTLQLASSAKAHGLETGAYFGLSASQKAAFYKAVDSKNWNAKVPVGWDAWHIQPRGISIKQARAGARPKF